MEQVAIQRSCGLVDRHLVVVEDDEDVGVGRCARIVKTLKGETSRKSTVANNSHYVTLFVLQLHGLGDAEGC